MRLYSIYMQHSPKVLGIFKAENDLDTELIKQILNNALFVDELSALYKPLIKPDDIIISPITDVILDTETTGNGNTDEVVQLSVIDAVTKKIIINSLIKPTIRISQGAMDVHGITNEVVQVRGVLIRQFRAELEMLYQYTVVNIYNESYDNRLINQSLVANNVPPIYMLNSHCLMLEYAERYGQMKNNTEYKWQKLGNAAEQQQIDISDLNAHNALDDCMITQRLFEKMRAKSDGFITYKD